MSSTHAASDVAVLWLCGPSGVGKSVTAWALFEALGDEGVRVAYVDIDQLGMLYPETEDDPCRYRLKTDALASLLPNYAAAGVQVLVVSGVVDPASPPDVTPLCPGARTTFCLLTVDEATLRQRILDRGWDAEDADEATADARALLEAPFIDAVVDTTGRTVPEVVERVRPMVALVGAPADRRPGQGTPSLPPASVDLTLVSGPRAVGSSTVGFGLARSRWGSGRTTGFMDLQQLAFMRHPDEPGHSNTTLGVANVTTIHRLFALRGAEQVIVSAHLNTPAEHDSVRHSAPDSRVCIIRLHADAATIAAHLRERSGGSDARLAGDDLVGASFENQGLILQVALAEQQALEADAAEDLLVDVSGRTIDDVVSEVEKQADGLRLGPGCR